jgi:hypothetical protein
MLDSGVVEGICRSRGQHQDLRQRRDINPKRERGNWLRSSPTLRVGMRSDKLWDHHPGIQQEPFEKPPDTLADPGSKPTPFL